MVESTDWGSLVPDSNTEQAAQYIREATARDGRLTDHAILLSRLNQIAVQLDRVELQNTEILAFRDLILESVGPFLTGGKSKMWLALLAKSKGRT